MRLLLLRHAEAEPLACPDSARELTVHGEAQARIAGDYCRRLALRPDLILTSPFVRTVQTGRIVAEALGRANVRAEPFLGSGMDPSVALREIAAYQDLASLMLIGHQPDLGLLLADLLGTRDASCCGFGLASLAAVRVERFEPRGGSIEFFVTLELMQASQPRTGEQPD